MDDGWTEGLINRQMDKVTHRCKDRQTNGPMELQIKGGTDGETGRQNEGFQNILYKLSIIIIYKYLLNLYQPNPSNTHLMVIAIFRTKSKHVIIYPHSHEIIRSLLF